MQNSTICDHLPVWENTSSIDRRDYSSASLDALSTEASHGNSIAVMTEQTREIIFKKTEIIYHEIDTLLGSDTICLDLNIICW